jgi:predicted dehydrogenase
MSAQVEGNCIMPMSFPFTTALRLVGTERAVEVYWYWGGTHPISEVILYPQHGEPEKLTIPGYDPYEAECRYFTDCVHGNTDPELLSIATAWNSLRMAVAANQSLVQHGQRIELTQLCNA